MKWACSKFWEIVARKLPKLQSKLRWHGWKNNQKFSYFSVVLSFSCRQLIEGLMAPKLRLTVIFARRKRFVSPLGWCIESCRTPTAAKIGKAPCPAAFLNQRDSSSNFFRGQKRASLLSARFGFAHIPDGSQSQVARTTLSIGT